MPRVTTQWMHPFDAHCCHIGTAIKHPVPHWVKPSAERQSAWMSKITDDGLAQYAL